jgi:hypothetical protein
MNTTTRKHCYEGVDENGKPWSVDNFGNDKVSMGWRWTSRCTSDDFIHWSKPVEMDAGDAPHEHIYTNLTQPYFRAPHIYISLAARLMQQRRVITKEEEKQIGIRDLWADDCSDAVLITSRGGNRYDRTFLEAFIRPQMGPQNWTSRTNYPAYGIVPGPDNKLYLYVNTHWVQKTNRVELYTLRTDGFVSVNAPYAGGELLTKPLRFTGNRLILNFATSAIGGIHVAIEDETGEPIPGFTRKECVEIIGNEIEREVAWKDGNALRALAGRPVRLRFLMRDADLFSFQFLS